MIIKRTWDGGWNGRNYCYKYTGWFLFGIIPLYIGREKRF